MILRRSHGHQNSHVSAVGVFDDGTETKEVQRRSGWLCKVGDRSIGQVSKDLDLTEGALCEWVKRADVDPGKGQPGALTTAEREELTRLRRENKRLQVEREILKKAAARSTGQRNVCSGEYGSVV